MKRILLLCLVITTPLPALTIQIDYTYDTTNFFNTHEKRNAMEAVAKFYGDMIQDKLLRIDAAEFPGCSWAAKSAHPVTGQTIEIPNLVVPADTIIVYVGARDLGGDVRGYGGFGGWSGYWTDPGWFPLLVGRGSAAAATEPATLRTDFSLWGGSIAFDVDSVWNFSQTQSVGGTDFISLALHEMGHVLGIGTADSWYNKISSAVFTGSACTRSFGGNPPLNGNGHFGGLGTISKSFGSFSATHGSVRQPLMLALLTDNSSTLIVASDLDLAALVDIGWQISPPHKVTTTTLSPSAASFSWNSSSFFDYRLERGTTLVSFPNGATTTAGNGGIQSWNDPAPPAGKVFYRLARTEVMPPQAAPARSMVAARASMTTASEEPRMIEGCGQQGH